MNKEIGMSTEINKTVARRIVEQGVNQGDMDVLDAAHASDFVNHAAPPGAPGDLDGFKAFVQALRVAFPDLHYHIDAEVAEGDMLTQLLTVRGTMTGEFNGMPPTGKTAVWKEMHMGRFVDGKLVEHWGLADQMGMLGALGYRMDISIPE
jgi:predicted ester cyclase